MRDFIKSVRSIRALVIWVALILFQFYDSYAQTTFVSGENPIFRNSFTADPAPLVHNGRLYIYVGKDEAKDGEMFTMTAWLCYSTTDMKNWTYHGPVMKPTDFSWAVADAWAAQVVEKNGKFYLYVTATGKNQYSGRAVGVAVSNSPTGPFVDAKGTPLVYESMTQNGKAWDDIDPTVLIDDDGTAYLAWGNPFCYFAKLKSNMIEIDGAITRITPPNYGEGPWLHKRNGIYYLTYAAFVAPTGSEQICYSTATNINGPWTYRGILTGTARNSYTIHPGIVEYKGQWYFFYHNATLTLNGQGPALGRRSVCVEYLCYNADGTIKPITQTTAGITLPPPCPPSGNPTVSITVPPNNAAFIAPASVNLTANATDPDGTISKVEFFSGTTKLGEDVTAPYTYVWTNVSAGTYTITAVATDNAGNKSTSSAVTIIVNPPQGPYNGTVHAIPGTIQFEAYDVGGNGFAYMDNTPGSAVTPAVNFRTNEDVDIENCTDTGGGYNIGFATSGEWLEYTVNVQTAGTYHMDLRVACNGDGRTLSVSMDGTNIASNVAIPNTTGWQTWQTVRVSDIALTAGQKIMRVTIGATDYINMNYVTFALSNNPPTVSITAPANNSTYTTLQSVTLTATASDADGNIASVSFYNGTTLLGTDNTSPYSYTWSGMSAGTHTITAKATDDKGGVTTSVPITVVVQGVQSPFNTNRHMIPGRIEAEEYDLGGEGLGYHEVNTNGNEGGSTFRNDEVDIEATGDAYGTYNVGYILEGEWLEYSVNVLTERVYDLDVRIASDGEGKTFHIAIDGEDVTGPITVPNTGGWQTWATVSVPGISLTEGNHQMRIVFDASYFNLNYVDFNEIITSVDNYGTEGLNIYPNPFGGRGFQILKSGEFTYRITSEDGIVLEEGKGCDSQTAGASLAPGMYILHIENNGQISVHKIVKH